MRAFTVLFVCLILLQTTGCFRSPDSHFFSLQAIPSFEPDLAVTAGQRVRVSVGAFPSYLNDPKMVTRRANGEIELNEYTRWVEELKPNFERVLMEDLASRLRTAAVFVGGPSEDREVDSVVRVEVIQFDVAEDGDAVLKVRWATSPTAKIGNAQPRILSLHESCSPGSPVDRVSALSRLVSRFADQVVLEIEGRKT